MRASETGDDPAADGAADDGAVVNRAAARVDTSAAADARRDAELRRGLRRMRTIATCLLAFVAVVYVVTRVWQSSSGGAPGWIGYVNSAAEAGVVGALADWFAVTALFKHPLGLPIPHTAIIPKRKDALGRGLEGFVSTHFLAAEVVREKVLGLGPAERLGAWLRQPDNAARVTEQASARLVSAVSGLSDEFVQEIVEKTVLPRLVERNWAPVVSVALRRVAEDGLHHKLVDLVAAEAQHWLERNPDTVHRIVLDQAPTWAPKLVNEAVAARVYFEAVRFVTDLRTDPRHRVRLALDSFLLAFADRLRDDPALAEQVEGVKRRVVEHPEANRVIAAMWTTTKSVLLDFASDPASVPRARITEEIAAFGNRLCTEHALQDTFDRAAADVATRLVKRYRGDIATIIGDTVARWQPDETSTKIELHVGRDLQFIRINGTVVGALAGLLIHLVTELLL